MNYDISITPQVTSNVVQDISSHWGNLNSNIALLNGVFSWNGAEYSYENCYNTDINVNKWYNYGMTLNTVTSGSIRWGNNVYRKTNGVYNSSALGAGTLQSNGSPNLFTGTVSNITACPYVLASLMDLFEVASPNVTLKSNITFDSVNLNAGFILNADSATNPQNFICVTLGGNSPTYASLAVYQVIAGVWTQLYQSYAQPYTPGKILIVQEQAGEGQLYYGGELTSFAVPSALQNNTLFGAFTTDPAAVFTNTSILYPISTIGSNVIQNGVFTNSSDWTLSDSNIAIANNSVVFNGNEAGYSYAQQNGLPINTWYALTALMNITEGQVLFSLGGGASYYNNYMASVAPNYSAAKRCKGGYFQIASNASPQIFQGSITNITACPISVSSMIQETTTINEVVSTGTEETETTITCMLQAVSDEFAHGLILNLDSAENPQNFVMIYLEGDGTMHFCTCENGIYTDFYSGYNPLFISNSQLKVIKHGLVYNVYINNTYVTSVAVTSENLIQNSLCASFSANTLNSAYNLQYTSQSVTFSYTVDKSIIKTVETPFIGTNWFNMFDGNNVNTTIRTNNDLQTLIDVCRKLYINNFRYPSGYQVRNNIFGMSSQQFVNAAIAFYGSLPSTVNSTNWFDIHDLFALLKANPSLKCSIQVNDKRYYNPSNLTLGWIKDPVTLAINWDGVATMAADAAAQVQYAKDNGLLGQIDYWEIGNEDYNDPNEDGGPNSFTGAEYGQICSIFIAAMRAVVPDLKIAVCTILNSGWWEYNFTPAMIASSYFAPYANDSNIYYVEHDYPSGSMPGTSLDIYSAIILNNTNYGEAILNNTQVVDNNSTYDGLVACGVANPQIVANEFRAGNANSIYDHSWIGAIGNARLINELVNEAGLIKTNIHNSLNISITYGVNNEGLYPILEYTPTGSTHIKRYPEAEIVRQYNKYLYPNILSSNSTNADITMSASTDSNGNISVFITNVNEERDLTLSFTGFNTLTCAYANYIGDFQDGWCNIAPNQAWGDQKAYNVPIRVHKNISMNDNSLTLTFKKNSFYVLQLKEAS